METVEDPLLVGDFPGELLKLERNSWLESAIVGCAASYRNIGQMNWNPSKSIVTHEGRTAAHSFFLTAGYADCYARPHQSGVISPGATYEL